MYDDADFLFTFQKNAFVNFRVGHFNRNNTVWVKMVAVPQIVILWSEKCKTCIAVNKINLRP